MWPDTLVCADLANFQLLAAKCLQPQAERRRRRWKSGALAPLKDKKKTELPCCRRLARQRSDVLVALLMAVVHAEDLPVPIFWKAEDPGALLAFTVLALF